jgi:hypothetical protein
MTSSPARPALPLESTFRRLPASNRPPRRPTPIRGRVQPQDSPTGTSPARGTRVRRRPTVLRLVTAPSPPAPDLMAPRVGRAESFQDPSPTKTRLNSFSRPGARSRSSVRKCLDSRRERSGSPLVSFARRMELTKTRAKPCRASSGRMRSASRRPTSRSLDSRSRSKRRHPARTRAAQ